MTDSAETQQSPWVYWLRWVALLPAAFAAYFVAQLIYALIQTVFTNESDWWIQLANSAIGPAAFVYYGTLTAPSHRVQTAIGLSIVICSIQISIVTLSALTTRQFGWPFVWLCVCVVVGIAAAIGVCTHFLKEEKEARY